MLIVGQAQGKVMQEEGVGAAEALIAVGASAAKDHKTLKYAALDMVAEDSREGPSSSTDWHR
jgi:hypothetical protein